MQKDYERLLDFMLDREEISEEDYLDYWGVESWEELEERYGYEV